MEKNDMKNTESRQEQIDITSENPKKNKKIFIIGGIILFTAVLAVLAVFVIIPSVKYSNANDMLAEKQFDDAQLLFEELGDYKDSQTMIAETEYQKARYTLQNGMYDEAKDMFANLGEYAYSKTMIDECTYQKAVNMISNKEFDKAKETFTQLGEYSDSADMIFECDYQYAISLLEEKKYSDAKVEFSKLGDYKDSETMISEVNYVKAANTMENGEYKSAISSYKKLGDYKDSEELLKKAHYANADNMYDDNKLVDAYEEFAKIPSYSDTADRMESLKAMLYELGEDAYLNNSDIEKAKEYFEVIPEYKDSQTYLILIALEQCNDFMEVSRVSNQYTGDELFNHLVLLLDDYDNALNIMLGDTWIGYFLEGEWTDGKNTMTVYETEESKEKREDEIAKYFIIGGSVTTTEYKISGTYANVVYFFDYNADTAEGDYIPIIEIEYVDYDTILIYSYSRDAIYRLDRVKD